MIPKNANVINKANLYVGFVLMFIKKLKPTIENYYYNSNLLWIFKKIGKFWYSLEGCIFTWKNIEKLKKIYVSNFNINTKYDYEWDNLQSKF